MKKKAEKIYLGLNVGTNSIGYAVTDEQYNLLKFNGNDAWGSIVFDAASSNEDRRNHRLARRNLDRRQQRIVWLQEIFAKEISKVDDRFFIRLSESFRWREDVQDQYVFFNDKEYTDVQYMKENPTIHHLICELMDNKAPHDVRLVYLACAWLIAHRGHYDAGKSVFWRAGFLGVCTGNRYTKLVYQMAGKANEENLMELVYEAIVDHKNSFLRLMEDNLDLFLQIPYESILFVKDFRKLLNLNTLQKKDILTLLKEDKECRWIYTYNTMDFHGLSGTYTFQELLAVCVQPEWIRKTYAKLDMRVDEKLRRIRQIFRFGSLKENRDPAAIAAALSNESFEDYCTRKGIKDASKSDLFQLMELEQADEKVSSVANAARTEQDVRTILRNRKPELFEMGLDAFKKAFTDLDTDSSWLKEQIEIPKEHLDAFTSFCLDGNASIVHDYYESNYGQQVENVLLIAKATIYGLLDEVKYKDLHKEIGYAITPEQENTWKENITLVDGKVKTGEYTDFVSCMNIGVLPERTCMNYRDGAYNECLLSTFDANKKVIYVTEEDEIIGRAILRLTKLSDEGDKNLHFEDVAEDTPENKENLVVFLERCYKNGFSGKKAAMIYRKLYDLAKRKAELLGAGLVLADDYKTVAELNGLAKKCSYIYVSESKNGKQYLDSLGGNCESGGYYVRGNFFFAS